MIWIIDTVVTRCGRENRKSDRRRQSEESDKKRGRGRCKKIAPEYGEGKKGGGADEERENGQIVRLWGGKRECMYGMVTVQGEEDQKPKMKSRVATQRTGRGGYRGTGRTTVTGDGMGR